MNFNSLGHAAPIASCDSVSPQPGSGCGRCPSCQGRASAANQLYIRGNGQPEVTYTAHPEWSWVASLDTAQLHTQFPLVLLGVNNLGFVWGQPAPIEIRHAQVSFDKYERWGEGKGRRWGVVADFPSEPEMVKHEMYGAGSGRDLRHLCEADRHLLIYSLLQPKDSRDQVHDGYTWIRMETKKEDGSIEVYYRNPLYEIEKSILATCPLFGASPVVDFDCFPAVTEPEKNEVVRAFKREVSDHLGIDPRAYGARNTGGKGRHVGIRPDSRFRHTHLYEIIREHILLPVLRRRPDIFKVFVAGKLKKKKEERTDPIMIDDSIMKRDPSSRGGQWRALGCPRLPQEGGGSSRYVDDEGRFLPVTGFQDRDLFLPLEILLRAEQDWGKERERKFRSGELRDPKKPRVKIDRTLPGVEGLTGLKEISAWVAQNAPSAGPHDLRLAMSKSLLDFGFSDDAVSGVLAAGTGNLDDARETVRSTRDRMTAGSPTIGLPWIRKVLGTDSVMDLAQAMARDTGKQVFDMVSRLIGRDYMRGHHAKFLHSLARSLAPEQLKKIGKALTRPTGCSITGDDMFTVDDGKFVGRCVHRCDGTICPSCAMRKCSDEYALVAKLWKGEGPFFFVEIESLPSLEAMLEFTRFVSRAGRPKLTVRGFKNGKARVTFVTNDRSDAAYVKAIAKDWARRTGNEECKPGDTRKVVDHLEAIDRVMLTKFSYHLHGRGLVEARDRERLVDFMTWSHRRRLVTKSTHGLGWPTKEQLKAERKKKHESQLDYDGQELFFKLKHLATDFVLHEQNYPHSLDQAMSIMSRHGGLKRHIRELAGLPDPFTYDASGKVLSYTIQEPVPIPA